MNDTADVPLGMRIFRIGSNLAQVIADLRDGIDMTLPEIQQHIDQLNRDFGNLRELLQSSDSSLAEALINPVLDRFVESLAAVAVVRPDLDRKCESLTNSIHKLLDPSPPEKTWDCDGPEIPF